MRTRDIIIGFIISLFVVPIAVFSIATVLGKDTSPTLTANPPARNEAAIVAAVMKSHPGLRGQDGKPIFKITSFKRIAGNWYIAWLDDTTTKVLINDPAYDAASMQVLLGPGTIFNQEDATSRGVPDAIYKELVNATV